MKKIVMLLIVFLVCAGAQALVIDDLNDTDLSEYTKSVVNDGNTERNVSFISDYNDLRVSYSGNESYEQVLLLRDDYSLEVGEMLVADAQQPSTSWDRDLGIAIGYTATPPALGAGESGDIRESYVEVCIRDSGQVCSYAHESGVGSLDSGVIDVTGVESIFIERIQSSVYQVGYITADGQQHRDLTVLWSGGDPLPAYQIDTNPPGAAVGFYADVRLEIAESEALVDNLRIAPIPLISPTPTDTESGVLPNPTLEWEVTHPNYAPYEYEIYLSKNLSEVDPDTATTPYATSTTNSLEITEDLERETTYYWRVDYILNEGDEPVTGKVWSFTTIGPTAAIVENPEAQVVPEGGTAQFTVDAINDEGGYAWYKEGDPTVLSTTDTLTIEDASLSDEGFYYCEVSGGGISVKSESAGLWTERLVGYWKLDGDLTDSVSEEIPGAPAHDAEFVDTDITTGDNAPNFVDHNSIAGQSMQVFFSEDGEHAAVQASDFFNYYPHGYTSSCWVKTSEPGWNVAAAKDGLEYEPDPNAGWTLVAGDWAASMPGGGNIYGEANLDEWVMLTSTYNPDTAEFRLYVNGVLQYDETGAATTMNTVDANEVVINDGPVRIGSDDGYNYGLDGFVDEVRLYSYPLSNAEVAQLYQQHISGSLCIEPVEYDINNDCILNMGDFAIIAENWLNCKLYPDCFE